MFSPLSPSEMLSCALVCSVVTIAGRNKNNCWCWHKKSLFQFPFWSISSNNNQRVAFVQSKYIHKLYLMDKPRDRRCSRSLVHIRSCHNVATLRVSHTKSNRKIGVEPTVNSNLSFLVAEIFVFLNYSKIVLLRQENIRIMLAVLLLEKGQKLCSIPQIMPKIMLAQSARA